MPLFLITFLLLYGGMHLYAFIKLRDAFRPRPQMLSLLVLWMMTMTFIPLLVHLTEQSGMEKTALAIAWPGYLWMGFVFIFTSTLFFSDAVYYLYRLLKSLFSIQLPYFIPSRHTTCKIVLFLALTASVYAFIEAGDIHSEHTTITSSKLPSTVSRIRIVQISDVHIGLLMQNSRLENILVKVREAKPDIIVSTGDLVDGKLNRNNALLGLNSLAASLASIPAPSGKYAVSGNHEVYAGLANAIAFTNAAGFKMLRNESGFLANGITITGVDDQAVIGKTKVNPAVEKALLNTAAPDSFHVLLKHRPDVQQESDGRFDLQLSGHVHGGQIFPFNLLVRLKHPIPCGTTTTPSGSYIHVSRGTGTWGPPMRLFVPPEVTIIDIVRKTPYLR